MNKISKEIKEEGVCQRNIKDVVACPFSSK